jgi:hypothetical protein
MSPTAASGCGEALELPQRVRAEPGRQTFLLILWSENEVWEAPKLSQQVLVEPGRQTCLLEDEISRDVRFKNNPSHSSPLLPCTSTLPCRKASLTAARVFPSTAHIGAWRAFKFPQRVRAEPGHQTCFGTFYTKMKSLAMMDLNIF